MVELNLSLTYRALLNTTAALIAAVIIRFLLNFTKPVADLPNSPKMAR